MSQIQFTPKQNEAFDLIRSEKYNFILYGGAIRGGKTIWGLASLLVLCEIFPRSRWAVVRESNERIRKTTIPSFTNNFTKRGTLRQSPYEYTHHNGSVILFIGENFKNDKELDAFKGLEVNGFLFEEINECQEVTLYKAFERAGSWIIPNATRQPKPLILATCNPSNNWVKELVYKPYKNNNLPSTWAYIPAKITDNPYLKPEYIESLKNLPRYQYMVYVEGDWDVQLKVGGEFYKCFELDKHVKPVQYNPELPLHLSFDENVNPYLPCGVFQIEGKEIRMVCEIAMKSPNNKVSDLCSEIKRNFPSHQSGMFIYGDATSQKQDTKLEKGHNFFTLIRDGLKEYHPRLKVGTSNPSVVMRGNFINTILEKEFDGIKIIIDEKCFLTINDFILVKESADGTKYKAMETDPKTGVRFQAVGHFSDLADYILCQAFSSEFQKYQRGGLTLKKEIGRNREMLEQHSY